ncbi:MAG: gliding motility protein GldN [Flavobacteriales bacterium CG03_land_8_20_14_0_80_35_15]|nr:gliding motility protein GldN [Zetaproteobacteria bacterium]OIO08756.1 MAG: gliding motility protein GldN [Flavobacteriaceae bacterium CG1_02_35_72]PIR13501.1 MAG: gliding motility protein GldN [Flavobacteriales bacterium CG11_big_fil_rev_8_21_14_0_20_35_7]PIV19248.1 MAG: gliding motility protein GldN [Flavobacteriales bacterium CG03_land_8_20_14_0_80_35_15]PIX07121.1 MAG: gliding motility protein GldN [Flavobacteriales bacterium CG_4_8_14_3_um_filter_35_10]PJA04761.1 MAG: gliding motility 
MKRLILLCLILGFSNHIRAQANLLNALFPEEVGVKTAAQIAADNDRPLPYEYIDDRDILWSKVVWEYVDLNEKMNLPYYYPIDTVNISNKRRSLYDTLMKGIKKGDIVDVYDDSYFQDRLTLKDITQRLSRRDTTNTGFDKLNAGEKLTKEDIDIRNITSADIEGFKIKGVWYFDKRQAELKYRLLGMAPVAPDVNFIDSDDAQDNLVELFWVWFPDARETLYQMKVFNPKNAAQSLSYDLIINARRFSSSIYKEENIYDNREIAEFIKGNALYQVLESRRIKEDVRNREIDMWQY